MSWTELKAGESWTDANKPDDYRTINCKFADGSISIPQFAHYPMMYDWNNVVAWEYADRNITNKIHNHYKKDVSYLQMVDVYRVLDLWQVNDHAIGHAIKKLLNAGQRGSKDMQQDIQEAIDSLTRWQEMQEENL
jgi:hypothetical protein